MKLCCSLASVDITALNGIPLNITKMFRSGKMLTEISERKGASTPVVNDSFCPFSQ